MANKKFPTPFIRFREFNGEVINTELGNISEIRTGPFGSVLHQEDYVENGTPIITVEHLGEQGIIHNNLPLVSDDDKARLKSYNLITNDIVFSRVGSVDRNSLISYKENGWLFSGRLLRIRTNTTIILPAYVSYYFQIEFVKYRIRSVAVGQTMPSLNTEILKSFKIQFPKHLPEQQKIASFLSYIDKKIQLLTRKKELLEQYKKGVMQQLFSGKLRFKPDSAKATSGNDEKGKAYPKWEEKRLGDVSIFLDGKRKPIKSEDRSKMKGEYPYYGASGIIDYVNQYIFDEEIILLGEDGENIVSRNLPLAFRVSGKCWINNHAHVIRPNPDADIDFLTFSLERINYEIYNTGTAQPKLNQEICRNIPLFIPCIEEQKKIANCLSNIDSKIGILRNQITQTQTFKKGLLQQMFV